MQDGTVSGSPDFLAGGGVMGARMRTHDWSTTSLGSPESWPPSLRTIIRILLTSRYQMWMAWGDELTFFCNDAYRPTLGKKDKFALGKPASEVWKEIWPDIGPRIEHVLQTGEATWDEGLLLLLERNGYSEETYHTFSYSPLADDSGKIVGMLCVVTEETERVIGERRLSCLRQLASEIAGKNVPREVIAAAGRSLAGNPRDLPFTLIYLFDKDGTARLACSTGVDGDQAIAPHTIAPQDSSVWPVAAVIAQNAPLFIQSNAGPSRLPTGAWTLPPREIVIAPIARQGLGTLAGFLVAGINPHRSFDDVYLGFINLTAGQIASALSNANAYEEERNRAEALAEIDRAKTTFFSNTSHEFRTPLTLLLSPLEDMLARRKISGPVVAKDEELELMHRNGLRLLKLVNTLLEFSRIEAGRVEACFTPVDLSDYTAGLASSFRSAMAKAGLRFVVDCPPLPEPIYVDREMWEKIVLNLISNAFKYTLQGEVVVGLGVAPSGKEVHLTVRDTGVGIPAHELPRLFERFHRIEGQSGRTQEGSGIGLALVNELVRLHGGSVTVESIVDDHTAVTVTLPTGSQHLPAQRIKNDPAIGTSRITAQTYVGEALRWLPDEALSEDSSLEADLGQVSDAAPGPRARVLLADDNADMRNYVRGLLASRYEVLVAEDGLAALELARQHHPHLVLSDIMMPRLDGFGLLRALRADDNLRDVPIILLSARAGEEASVEGLDAGADDYLVKPFNARELLARVRSALELAALRRQAVQNEAALRRVAEDAQERAESILKSINDGFLVFDSEWRFTHVNAAAERMMGKSADSLIGQILWEVYPLTPESITKRQYQKAMNERVSVAFETYYADWDRWLDIRAYPAGRDSLAVYFQDITDKKAAEEALQQLNESLESLVEQRTQEVHSKEARLRSVFETSFTYQGLLALDGTLFDANATSLEGIGKTLDDIVGLPFWETPWFAGTPGMPQLVQDAIAVAAKGETVRQEIHVKLPVGGWRWFDFVLRPIHDSIGTVVAIVPEAVELTARREAEEALRHAQKMEAIGQLTGGVAHDFNNLLTVIRSSADLLRLRDLPEDRRSRYVNAIADTADRAAKLTSQLLAFSRRQPLKPLVFDLAVQIESIADMLKTVLGTNIALRLEVSERPLVVEADLSQLETALVNLTANARDAMSGQGSLVIGIAREQRPPPGVARGGSFVAITVTDTGCGISTSDLEHIFEPFFTTKDVGRGTGLGLAQVYGFARQSGGIVTVTSEVGVGTIFTLQIPLSAKPINTEDTSDDTKTQLPPARGCILVVEDNRDVGEFSSQLLRELGYKSVLATNADEALARLDEHAASYDLVFSDVVMPGRDGVTLAREIRLKWPTKPVVLTSGYSQVLASEGSHGFELLQKPYSVEELARVLRNALAVTSGAA